MYLSQPQPLTTHSSIVPKVAHVKRVLYVTHSEHVQENEDVIERLLEERSVDLVDVGTLGLQGIKNESDYGMLAVVIVCGVLCVCGGGGRLL